MHFNIFCSLFTVHTSLCFALPKVYGGHAPARTKHISWDFYRFVERAPFSVYGYLIMDMPVTFGYCYPDPGHTVEGLALNLSKFLT